MVSHHKMVSPQNGDTRDGPAPLAMQLIKLISHTVPSKLISTRYPSLATQRPKKNAVRYQKSIQKMNHPLVKVISYWSTRPIEFKTSSRIKNCP